MGILIKFTLRNIKEHKFRTFLIILSIALSVGLFFASFSISDTLTSMIMNQIKTELGSSEVLVMPSYNTGATSIKIKALGEGAKDVEYQVGSFESSAKFKGLDNKYKNVSLKGFKISDLEIMNPLVFITEKVQDTKFIGKQVIVGKDFAVKNKLRVDDVVKLKFGENDVKYFNVAAVVENQGFLKKSMYGEDNIKMIVPIDILQKFTETKTGVQLIYAKSTNDKEIKKTIETLKGIYPKGEVQKTITKSEIDSQIKPIRMPFMFMLLLVVIISVFIIYTSFKVIMLERLPMLGTFRSMGATKKMTNSLMLWESIIYGVIGSGIGVVLGIGVLKLLMKFMMSTMGEMGGSGIAYPFINVVIAITFGMVLCFCSGLIPIIKTTKIPVKEILLNIVEGTKKKKKSIRYIIAGIATITAIVLPQVFKTGMNAAIAGGGSVVLVILTMILLVPFLTDMVLIVLGHVLGVLFGNIGLLASKNLKGNKSTYDNIVLLTIGLTSIVAISVLSMSMKEETMAEFTNSKYDIEADIYEASNTTVQRIMTVDGIEKIVERGSAYNPFTYKKDKKFMRQVEGVDSLDYFKMVKYDVLNTENDQAIFEKVLSGRNLIISTQVRDKYKLKLNETITVKTTAGNRVYTIIGFIQTKKGNGSFGITSISNLKNDMKQIYGKNLIIQTYKGTDNNQVVEQIKVKLKNVEYQVKTLEKRKAEYAKENSAITTILSVFSYATALIGSVGVMNNFMVSFLSRRKSLAIMTSVGMSKVQRKKMILIEAVAAGLVGGLFGMFTGQIIVKMVERLLKVIEINMTMNLTLSFALVGIVCGVFVCVISSLGVVRQSGRFSVLEELKYE